MTKGDSPPLPPSDEELKAQEKEKEMEESLRKYPDMKQAQNIFLLELYGKSVTGASSLTSSDNVTKEEVDEIKATLQKQIREEKQIGLYKYLCNKFGPNGDSEFSVVGWDADAVLEEELSQALLEEENNLRTKYEGAVEAGGETDVLDAMLDKCKLYAKVGEKEKAYGAMKEVFEKPKISSGKKLDITMDKIRMAMFYGDSDIVKNEMVLAKKLCEEGGDWDRRNRLKVYESLYLISARQLKEAANLLKDCISTFTCIELCDFEEFVFYASITNILFLSRAVLKKEIIEGADTVVVLREAPSLESLLISLYDCDYAKFFQALFELIPQMERNRYFNVHIHTLIRELRILAYSQYLESYKSVTMHSMATAFGIAVEFLDSELSRFIASGRLSAKIDKVSGVVETSRADHKNSSYQKVIKDGDALLNRLSKLSRLINQ